MANLKGPCENWLQLSSKLPKLTQTVSKGMEGHR